MLKIIIFILAATSLSIVNAQTYIVSNTIISVYAQSTQESTANLIAIKSGMYNGGQHPWCGNRAYISFEDKQLFATALAASISNKPVNIIYEDAAEQKTAAAHISFGCKLLSIWWDL